LLSFRADFWREIPEKMILSSTFQGFFAPVGLKMTIYPPDIFTGWENSSKLNFIPTAPM
jgi:hypothetical protein